MTPITINGKRLRLDCAKLEHIIDLRHRLLRAGLPRESAIFAGDELPTTLHFTATCSGKVVCCLTLMLSTWQDSPAWQLRGMATEPEMQRTGVGRRLVAYALRTAARRQPQIRCFWCNARVPAKGFYEKLGWQIVSEPFEIETAGPHVKMVYERP